MRIDGAHMNLSSGDRMRVKDLWRLFEPLWGYSLAALIWVDLTETSATFYLIDYDTSPQKFRPFQMRRPEIVISFHVVP